MPTIYGPETALAAYTAACEVLDGGEGSEMLTKMQTLKKGIQEQLREQQKKLEQEWMRIHMTSSLEDRLVATIQAFEEGNETSLNVYLTSVLEKHVGDHLLEELPGSEGALLTFVRGLLQILRGETDCGLRSVQLAAVLECSRVMRDAVAVVMTKPCARDHVREWVNRVLDTMEHKILDSRDWPAHVLAAGDAPFPLHVYNGYLARNP